MTAALINSNLRQASLTHCITVGRCKVQQALSTTNQRNLQELDIVLYVGDNNYCMFNDSVPKDLCFCLLQGIIFDYSLREAVADVNEDLISFNENFSFFHVSSFEHWQYKNNHVDQAYSARNNNQAMPIFSC